MESNGRKADQDLFQDISRALGAHQVLREIPVTARVADGCVTMSGTVHTWKQARDACRLAGMIDGVVQLKNELVVVPCEAERRTDEQLAEAARNAVRNNLLIGNDIRATAKDGVVTLTGAVPYASQRYDAEIAIERVCGLRGVVNQIRVVPVGHVDLSAARDTVIQALKRHAASDGMRLCLEDRQGVLHVSGALDSLDEKDCVLTALRGMPGAHQVVDDIRIASHTSAMRLAGTAP